MKDSDIRAVLKSQLIRRHANTDTKIIDEFGFSFFYAINQIRNV